MAALAKANAQDSISFSCFAFISVFKMSKFTGGLIRYVIMFVVLNIFMMIPRCLLAELYFLAQSEERANGYSQTVATPGCL